MYKAVYDQFKHWYHDNRGSIWLYSDPHFNDEEMQYLRKNYIGDDEQIKRINSKVGKYDTIIFLGDIGDLNCIKKIRGYKVLIMGNHDQGATNFTPYFDEVYEGILAISEKIILSHEPIDFPYVLNIHGHDHSGVLVPDSVHVNLCAEHIDYTPINLKEIVSSGILKPIVTIHRATIDTATAKKKKK